MSPRGPLAAVLAVGERSAPVTHLGERLIATVILAGLVFGVFAAMRHGWRRRARGQADLPPLPALPPTPALDREPLADGASAGPPPLVGRYHGSTMAGDWLDRVVAHGLGTPSAVRLTWTEAGVAVQRPGAASFLIPAGALLGARLDRAIAGVTPPPGGLLVLTWRHGERVLDSGFRADHVAEHPAWVSAVTALVEPVSTTTGESGAADQTERGQR